MHLIIGISNLSMHSFKTIYIAGINRSGGSLLARLFDNHTKILSYPIELGFPRNHEFFNIIENYTGIPQSIPTFDHNKKKDIFELLELPKVEPQYSTKWGEEHSDPLGVRKNYLEKVFYGNIKTDFDYNLFKNEFVKLSSKANNIKELYDARHTAYFKAWDNNKYLKDQSHIVMHDSGGIYLTNINTYFESFDDSRIVFPLRDIVGYVAAEKTRLARRYFGSRRFSWPTCPNMFVKMYDNYDINAQIMSWMTAITRVRLIQEKYGIDDKFIIYSNTRLIEEPKETMSTMSDLLGLEYEDTLINPTISGKPWLGNSHYGPVKGISKNISKNYDKVLTENEIEHIKNKTYKLIDNIDLSKTPINLLELPDNLFYDYSRHKRYFSDEEKIVLYSALNNSIKRRGIIKKVTLYSVLAIVFSLLVRIIHIPRLLKLRYSKGLGKQNYT